MSNFLQTQIYDIRTVFHKTVNAGIIETWALGDEKCFKFSMRLEKCLPPCRSNKEWPEKF
jgi:hypothetical protein